MKTLRHLVWIIFLYPSLVYSQKNPKAFRVGSSSSIIKKMANSNSPTPGQKSESLGAVTLQLSPTESVVVDLTVQKTKGNAKTFAGKVRNEKSKFNLVQTAKLTEGSITFEGKDKAYKLYADDNDNLYSEEVGLDELVCIGMEKVLFSNPSETTVTLPEGFNLYQLQSYPLANAVVLLDFDGQYVPTGPWGSAINAEPAILSREEIFEAWQVVSEDFRPFNLNITTDESVFFKASPNQRMRVIFTPTTTAYPGSGGVAYIGSFVYGDDYPCWVFNSGGKYAGETASHEIGHTLNLFHDGTYDGTYYSEYYWGNTFWGPIMGASFSPRVVQWSKGEYLDANNKEDDLSIIASSRNEFGYRNDDVGNTIANAFAMAIDNNGVINASVNSGNIETNTDEDVYSFSTGGGIANIRINLAKHSNLHPYIEIRDANGNIYFTYKEQFLNNLNFDVNLIPGKYYLSITGVGTGNPLQEGYTDYGSIGFYSIAGTIPVPNNLREPENPSNTITGVDYKYYEGEGWSFIPDFASIIPIKTGSDTNFVLSSRNRDENFAYSYTAFLQIPTDGVYTFYTRSDDGSKLYIGSQLVVENDGLHANQERSGTIGLKAGKHAIRVDFFERGGQEVLEVLYSSSAISKRRIAGHQLFRINRPSYRNPENPSNVISGVNYKYYEGTDWRLIPDFNSLTSVMDGSSDNFSLASRKRDDNFGFAFNGFVEIQVDGLYTFYTNSDDGSKLYIGSQLVVDNDGLHANEERSGTIGLKAGKHAIRVDFFERGGQEILGVQYEGPGVSKQSIPSNRLFRINTTNFKDPENPGALVSGLTYKYFEGAGWNSVQNLTSLSPIKTGVSRNFSLGQRNRDEDFGFEFNGYIQVPVDGMYKFYTASDDGSKLFIGSTVVVDNDGLHPSEEKNGSIGLKGGKHAIKVVYFERSGQEVLEVRYEGPSIGKRIVTDSVLFRPTNNAMVSFGESISLYPNPAKDQVNIETVNGTVIEEVVILDAFSNKVKTVRNDSERVTIEVSNLRFGIYTVQIITTEDVVTKRLQIE